MVEINLVASIIITCSLVGSCVGYKDQSLRKVPDYNLIVIDEPPLRLFRLYLKSESSFKFCIESESWPTKLGKVAAGSQRIQLHWNDGCLLPEAVLKNTVLMDANKLFNPVML
jgi:hypothetical protein